MLFEIFDGYAENVVVNDENEEHENVEMDNVDSALSYGYYSSNIQEAPLNVFPSYPHSIEMDRPYNYRQYENHMSVHGNYHKSEPPFKKPKQYPPSPLFRAEWSFDQSYQQPLFVGSYTQQSVSHHADFYEFPQQAIPTRSIFAPHQHEQLSSYVLHPGIQDARYNRSMNQNQGFTHPRKLPPQYHTPVVRSSHIRNPFEE